MRRRLLSNKKLWSDEFYLSVSDSDRDSTGFAANYTGSGNILLNGLNKSMYPDEEHFYAYDAGGDGYYGGKYIDVIVGPRKITEKNYVAIIHTYISAADIGNMYYLSLDGSGNGVDYDSIWLYSTSDPNSAYEMVYQNVPTDSTVWYPSERNIYDVLCIVKNDFFKKHNKFYFTSAYGEKPPYNYNSLPTMTKVSLYEGTDNEVFNIRNSGSNRYVTTLKQPIGYFDVYSRWINHINVQKPIPEGGLSFALHPKTFHNEKDGLSYNFNKNIDNKQFVKIFSDQYYGASYFMFGVWKESETLYHESNTLWKMYIGSNENNLSNVGLFTNRTNYYSYTDISEYGIKLMNGSSVDFADNSYKDYGNITWINGATSGIYMGAFQFELKKEVIDNITSGLSDNTKLVIGIYSPNQLSRFRGNKYDGFDDLPANGYRIDTEPHWVWTAINDGPYRKNNTEYFTTTVGEIKTGGNGFYTPLFSLGG